jgi:serine/threonine protein kinase
MNAVSASAATPKACPSCGGRFPVDALFCPADGTPLSGTPSASGTSQDPYLQREILGHIQIKQLVGVGAMGRVYRAFQNGIDRDVAVKILHRELSANQQLVNRFHREAKVASRLQHPNVVHAYLTGQLPDGAMYIVMEFLDGMSLQSALAASGGAMPLQRALHIMLQICDAVGEAHDQGIIHRDIKPENVMLVRRGATADYAKVLDFGIARLNWGDQSMATAAGLIFGTARYISPEGAQGEHVGPESDVYSLATLAYQMLAGRTPFEGEQAVALLVQQIHDPPPPLRSIQRAGYVPQPIAEVIMENLAKSPKARESDANGFGRALLEAAKSSGLSPEQLVLGARSSAPVATASMQRTRQLNLDPETAAKLAPPPASSPRTAYQAPRTEVGDIPIPAGNATTKWTPPPGFEARLVPPAPPSRPRTPSSVDDTMDDETAATAAPATARTPSPADRHPSFPDRRQPSTPDRRHSSVPDRRPSEPRTEIAEARAPSKPPSGVDTTLGDEEGLVLRRRSRVRAAVLVCACFMLGAAGAGGVAYKMGLIGAQAATKAGVDSYVARANDALLAHKYDKPNGDNVRDITGEALARWPGDPRIVRIRELAADALLDQAREKQKEGDVAEALRLARLAEELDPHENDAKSLVADLEREAAAPVRIPPLSATTASPSPLMSAKMPLVLATSVRGTLDVSVARPRVGQPVDLVARVIPTPATARPRVDGAHFVISGPHISGVRLPATEENGQFRAGYTFLEPGRYEVLFIAKADAFAVRSARTLHAGEGGAPAAPTTAPPHHTGDPTPPQPPTTAPTHSGGNWL